MFIVLLVATGLLYLWGLGASGWANSFYSAAAQAGSASWKALFFGSSDAANAITVDKPPLALWFMGLSVRAFGLSSWSILVPQALMGVASVGLLTASVRRWFGWGAGLLAGAVLATTPVAALMFRFNNPDALLVLLLVAGAYAMVRALERGRMWWVVAAGSAVGLAFLTKMLQALLVVPAFAAVYLLAAPITLWSRLRHVLAGGAAMVASAGWWVAIVELWPASSRPYIGGSQSNSVLELIFGYNGVGRLTGDQTGSVVGARAGGAGGGMWGETSWHRMFDADWSGQFAWLIPAALLAIVAGLVLAGRSGRIDRLRAATVLWGGWLLVTMATFSFGRGIIHQYYSVALAPAIGALVAIGGHALWARRAAIEARGFLAAGVLGSAVFARAILGNTPDWQPWLRSMVMVAGVVAAVFILAGDGWHRRAVWVSLAASTVALLAAPTAFSIQTAASPHSGPIPTAGPASGFGPAGRPARMAGGPPAPPGGGTGGGAQPGGLLRASTASAAVVAALREDAGRYRWAAAAVGSNSASGFQLASQLPVMAIGGFNGSDPAPTLAQFQLLVRQGRIHWFIGGGGGMGGVQMGGSRAGTQIADWVAANFTARSVDGVTLYDLSGG